MYRAVRVQTDDFQLAREYDALRRDAGAGAIAAFVGLVRDRFDGREVRTLELEHYPGMTERSIEGVVDRAADRWQLSGAVVIHRIGVLAAGEQIVLVLTAAAHRHAAFDACRYLMDYLKTDAVLWKKERLTDGERWIEATDDDRSSRAGWDETR